MRGRKARVIAIASEKRLAAFPEVPTTPRPAPRSADGTRGSQRRRWRMPEPAPGGRAKSSAGGFRLAEANKRFFGNGFRRATYARSARRLHRIGRQPLRRGRASLGCEGRARFHRNRLAVAKKRIAVAHRRCDDPRDAHRRRQCTLAVRDDGAHAHGPTRAAIEWSIKGARRSRLRCPDDQHRCRAGPSIAAAPAMSCADARCEKCGCSA